MTARQAYKTIGGKSAFCAYLKKIRQKHNLKILETYPISTDGEEEGSAAVVVFGYDNSDIGIEKAYAEYGAALDEIMDFLARKDCMLSHECNGDGDGRILMSFRIC